MSTVNSPPFHYDSPPFFSATWLGRHPVDHQPRLVECFGPSIPDAYAAVQAAVLGLESALLGKAPSATSLTGDLVGRHLVLHSRGHELLRTDPLPVSLLTVLHQRPEVLLVWVDVPLQDPRTELPTVGVQHVWTGTATIRAGA